MRVRELNVTVMEGFTKFIAEALGTAFLMFGGCMGCITWDDKPPAFAGAISFGLVVMIMIQCFGHLSGAHFNPAVTVAAIVFRSISIPMGIIYFFAQLIGATVGYRFLVSLIPAKALGLSTGTHGFCQTVPHEDLGEFEAFTCEYIATMVLISVCCACWDPRNSSKQDSLAIKFGLSITILSYIFGPFTNCSMNPVRSFAPAFWNHKYPMHWIYWVSPTLSAFITSLGYKFLFMEKPDIDLEAVQPLRPSDDIPKV
ncbi:aquaporin-2-like isoform X2 [Contarinia nasturtii]|uniref:aquaporin-2-like isoform X2 n=1 Tax=Contarinia nasturtii TaxID=265458 RepID=UPI0012D48446|nr:aquaporin-2-like isoform X2 [Contarinia nasturtii]